MSQHHKLVCGSLFVFFAATHAGCAGSGLKNLFTRNETDGYHSLDEIETEEPKVAADEATADEAEKPSMATRLASWRPFNKAEATEDNTSAAIDAVSSEEDSEDAGTNRRFLGRAFTKRGSVEPDPFLSAEPKLADGPESSAVNAIPHQQTAKIHDESQQSEDEFVLGADPKPKLADDTVTGSRRGRRHSELTDDDTSAVALQASRKDESSDSSDDEDDAIAERFEQHFLQNSIETVAKTKTEAAATGKDLRHKVSTRAESKKRELSSIAERQKNQFDFLLAADPDSDATTSGDGLNSGFEPSQISKRSASTSEKSGNSLAAFDQLLGTDSSAASHAETEATETESTTTAARTSKKKHSAMDVNVADAEALFGAAAARQNSRLTRSETAHRTESSDRQAEDSSVWSQASENPEGIESEDSRHAKSGTQSDRNRNDVASALARHLSGATKNGKARIHSAAFSAPMASAGDVEGDVDVDSAAEATEIHLSNTSAFSNNRRIVTTNYGTAQPGDAGHTGGIDSSTVGHAQFAAAPAAPLSPQESDSEAAVNATQPGLVQSFSIRNWLLLIGGVIVIALLFAPGRTKPLTMNNRPANG